VVQSFVFYAVAAWAQTFVVMPAPHEVLGVPAGSDSAAIRKQFFKEARICHPDKRPADEPPEVTDKMKRRFVELHEAYEAMMSYHEAHGPVRLSWHMPEAFNVTAEQVSEAKANLRDAEEHLEDLKKQVQKAAKDSVKNGWNEEEMVVMRRSRSRAYQAVMMLERQVMDLEGMLGWADVLNKAQEAADAKELEREEQIARSRQQKRETEETQPANAANAARVADEGPDNRTVIDHCVGVGSAFGELAEDVFGLFKEASRWLPFARTAPVAFGPDGPEPVDGMYSAKKGDNARAG